MSWSPDLAEIVAQVQQQCIQEAKRECDAIVQDANVQLEHLQGIIVQLNKDNFELKQSLSNQLQEVCAYMYDICG